MILTLPYPPSINMYWRTVRGRIIKSKEGRLYQEKAKALAREQVLGAPIQGPVHVSVSVFRPRRIGDLDNTLKVLLDSLRGIAYDDDSQIVRLEARRNDDAKNPRTIVIVAPEPITEPASQSPALPPERRAPPKRTGLPLEGDERRVRRLATSGLIDHRNKPLGRRCPKCGSLDTIDASQSLDCNSCGAAT